MNNSDSPMTLDDFYNNYVNNFYNNEIVDGMINTSKLFLGSLTYVEGNPSGMLCKVNDVNNQDEKCVLALLAETPHSGCVYLDVINKTLLETKEGFMSWIPNTNKVGVLVEDAEPLEKLVSKTEMTLEELKVFVDELNKQNVKLKKL